MKTAPLGAVFISANELLSDLPLAQLVERLAVDAQRRRWARFQPLQADLDTAAVAVAVFVGVDARDRLVDLLDQLALAIAVAQLERHVGFLAGAVVGVGEHRRLVLHGVHRAVDLLRQLRLERLQDLAEMLPLLPLKSEATLYQKSAPWSKQSNCRLPMPSVSSPPFSGCSAAW